jgi:hypothetical protein
VTGGVGGVIGEDGGVDEPPSLPPPPPQAATVHKKKMIKIVLKEAFITAYSHVYVALLV